MVAPPWYPIPPQGYGGIEWMMAWLAEALIDRGHDVTIIGVGEQQTRATLIPTFAEPQWPRLGDALVEFVHAAEVDRILDDLAADLAVDVVHDHSGAGPLSTRHRNAPTVLTAHGPADHRDLGRYYQLLATDAALVAISHTQRDSAPGLPWAGTVHNAIPVDEFPFQGPKDDFCLFLGRMSPEKAPDLAIKAARAAGCPIVLAAKCNERDEHRYFEQHIRPLLGPDAEWLGEVGTEQKKDLLRRARCLVNPIQWNEPFGIVMVEAMACGTPVVALRNGSAPELVDDAITGFLCDRPSELAWAIVRSDEIEPKLCRQHVADNFDVATMAAKYEAIYRTAIRTAIAARARPSRDQSRTAPRPSAPSLSWLNG